MPIGRRLELFVKTRNSNALDGLDGRAIVSRPLGDVLRLTRKHVFSGGLCLYFDTDFRLCGCLALRAKPGSVKDGERGLRVLNAPCLD